MASAGDRSRGETLLFDILHQVAHQEQCDVVELPPLYESVDPEALAALAGSTAIRFTYSGYEITVADGTVTVA